MNIPNVKKTSNSLKCYLRRSFTTDQSEIPALKESAGILHCVFLLGSPDDAIFRQLATAYSNGNDQMAKSTGCSPDDGFDHGITNGAAWYSVGGGMICFFKLSKHLRRFWCHKSAVESLVARLAADSIVFM